MPPAVTPAPPAIGARPAPNRPAAQRDALETNTLAELYVKQGLPDRAIDVYRSMLRVEPGNAAARRRLAELEAAAPAPAARSASPEPARRPPAPPPAARDAAGVASAARVASVPGVSSSPASAPGSAPPAPARVLAPADRAAIERLERWLGCVKAGRDRQGGGAAA
jgi:pentatricopeptide repeat protein